MPLTLRLILTYLVVTLGGMFLLGFGFITLAERYVDQQRYQELAAQAEVYSRFLSTLVDTSTQFQVLAPDLAASRIVPANVTVRLFAANGTLLSASRGLGPFPSRPVLAYVSSSLPVPISQVATSRYVATPVMRGGDILGIVELSHTTTADASLQHALRTLVLQAALLAALVMILVSVLVARSIAHPVKRLTQCAEALAAYEGAVLPSAVPLSVSRQKGWAAGSDEIALLEYSLDRMAAQLQAHIHQVEQERTRLAVVLATVSEGVVALDRAGTLLFYNPAASMMLELPASADIPAYLANLGIPLHPSTPIEHEVRAGQRVLLVTSSPVQTTSLPDVATLDTPADEPATVLVLRDITRLKELEQARNRFFRSISHDLRTPLTAIRGTIENLRDSAPFHQQAAFATLEEETARLARLVDELLHPSANGVLLLTERSPVDIGRLVEDLCTLQQGRARRAGLSLNDDIALDLPLIYGDRDRLKQALLNLLDNALRITPTGGQINVQVALVAPEQPFDPAMIQIRVADSGPGVPPDLRERIWERGVRGTDAGGDQTTGQGGAGLGLAIVREIATAHGGQARIEEHPTGGACFVLELPVAAGGVPRTHYPGESHVS